jgi:hypothetical protein
MASTPKPRSSLRIRTASELGPSLLFNIAAIDLNDMSVTAFELDAKSHFRLREGEITPIAHDPFDQNLSRLVEDAHRHTNGSSTVAESTLARDCVIAVVKAIANRIVREGDPYQSTQKKKEDHQLSVHSGNLLLLLSNLCEPTAALKSRKGRARILAPCLGLERPEVSLSKTSIVSIEPLINR